MSSRTSTSLGTIIPFTPTVVGARLPVLSREQLDIITETDTHVMVEAGAGSGKTATLVEKILYEVGCSPLIPQKLVQRLTITEIGAITFTNKAAGELTERLQTELLHRANVADGQERERIAMLGHQIGEARIGTIDSFAARLLNEFGSYGGFAPYFEIVEHPRRLYASVAEQCLERGLTEGEAGASFLVRHFGSQTAREFLVDAFARGDLLLDLGDRLRAGSLRWNAVAGLEGTAVDRLLEPRSHEVLAFALAAYGALEHRMMELGAFDHVQVMTRAAALADHPYVQAKIRGALKLLIVDEHQDTNLVQCRLLFRLAGLLQPETDLGVDTEEKRSEGRPELRVVLIGDPKQSIYAFRGADVTLWETSSRLVRSRGGRCLTLRDNYRTRPTVVRFYDACLGRIMPARVSRSRCEVPYRSLVPKRPETPGGGVEILLASQPGGRHVAEVVADRIAEMLRRPHEHTVCDRLQGGVEFPRAVRPSDIAILARTMRGAVQHYERALLERGIPCRVLGGQGLFARIEVQDLVTFLRALADPADSHALAAYLRSPLGNVDDVTITELAAAAERASLPENRRSLFDALERAQDVISDPLRAERAGRALALITRLRPVVDRVPHSVLLNEAIKIAEYEPFLAGAPDAVAARLNVHRLVSWLGQRSFMPLRQLAEELRGRVAGAEYDEESCSEPDDRNVVTLSTIHAAKGLEWPVVFVTGLDENVARRVRPERPRLDAELGVVLPLHVVISDEDCRSQSSEEISASWERHGRGMVLRDYAEAKRIFYVACTRARDRLILAGALNHGSSPKTLDPEVAWMHADGVERWLRHIYPQVTQTNPRARLLPYGSAPSGEPRTAHDVIQVLHR